MRGGKEAGKLTAKTLTVELEVHERLGMKLATPEIVWHSKEPLLSADFHRAGPSWRLATGGADNDVKVKLYSILLTVLPIMIHVDLRYRCMNI